MELNIGIDVKDREQIAAGLSKLLADSYSLYLKTHNYHWNVTGPQFNTLHLMFETQYTEPATAVLHETYFHSLMRRTMNPPPIC